MPLNLLSQLAAKGREEEVCERNQSKEEREREREMAISGDLKAFGTFAYCSKPHHDPPLRHSLPSSKMGFNCFFHRANSLRIVAKSPHIELSMHNVPDANHVCFGTGGNKLSPTIHQDVDGFLSDIVNMNFFDRLSLAWKILFPTAKARTNSNARIAKQRLKMILFSDRCAVSDEAKKKIVTNVIEALSEFVEIDKQDKVQLNVSTDTDLGTVYSVTVPVRRVKPEYQESEDDYTGKITSIEYNDTGETSGTVDVTFDFFLPNKS